MTQKSRPSLLALPGGLYSIIPKILKAAGPFSSVSLLALPSRRYPVQLVGLPAIFIANRKVFIKEVRYRILEKDSDTRVLRKDTGARVLEKDTERQTFYTE